MHVLRGLCGCFRSFPNKWDLVIKTSDVGGPLVYRTAPEVEVSYNNVLVKSVVDGCDSRAFLVCYGTSAPAAFKAFLSILYRASLLRRV